MIIKIIINRSLPIKERVKKLIAYLLSRRGASILWKREFKIILKHQPLCRKPVEKSIENAHRLYWKPFRSRINMATLRDTLRISGIAHPKIIPEEVYVTDIEPTLNSSPTVDYLSNKSLYNHWFPGKVFPHDFLHNIDGEWLDHELNPISPERVSLLAQELPYPVVLKPNRDSYGGKNIYFPRDVDELMNLVKKRKNFLVQEKIKQHSFFNQFNHRGLNTIRVNVYRSVSDNKLHIINMAMRMGVGGSLDNVTSGGIVTRIKKNGFLNGWAIDKYGKKFFRHPDTGVDFNIQIPDLIGLQEMALKIAGRIFYARLISLDCCYDTDENWRMIEVNLFSGSICFAQQHGALYFDEFTDEVRDYCIKNHWALV
ncbi:MAG: hypothetical protein JXK95_14055 [Bacteroidales bacterium]|nr:hypothetical protein [Bacteroidales bacterium]